MRTPTKQGLQVLRRVRDFLVENEVTAALGSLARQVEALGGIIDRLSQHAVEQDANERAFRAGAQTARQLSRALRLEFIRPVARMGRSLFPDNPSLRQALSMPRANDYQGLIAAALAMAERATEHKDAFVAAGFGEDFVERVRKAADALRSALDQKAVHFGQRAAATAGLLEEMSRGREIVRLLEAMVTPQLENAPDRLAQWRTLARFVRATPAEAVVPPPTPPKSPATPATAQSAVTASAPLDKAA